MTYRVLVTGSRTWNDRELIRDTLDALLAEHGTLTVVHGAASTGADTTAQGWALDRRHQSSYGAVTPEPHPADWRRYGRAAGFRRNAAVVALGADLCLAFIRNGSHGATHCADLAERAGIPVRRFTEQHRAAAVARVAARGSRPEAAAEAEGDFGPGGIFAGDAS